MKGCGESGTAAAPLCLDECGGAFPELDACVHAGSAVAAARSDRQSEPTARRAQVCGGRAAQAFRELYFDAAEQGAGFTPSDCAAAVRGGERGPAQGRKVGLVQRAVWVGRPRRAPLCRRQRLWRRALVQLALPRGRRRRARGEAEASRIAAESPRSARRVRRSRRSRKRLPVSASAATETEEPWLIIPPRGRARWLSRW